MLGETSIWGAEGGEAFTAALLNMMVWYGIVKRGEGCRWQLGGKGSAADPLCHYFPRLITSLAMPEKNGKKKRQHKTKLTVSPPKLKMMGGPKEWHRLPVQCRNADAVLLQNEKSAIYTSSTYSLIEQNTELLKEIWGKWSNLLGLEDLQTRS